jgi:hypothetical protein
MASWRRAQREQDIKTKILETFLTEFVFNFQHDYILYLDGSLS